VGTVGFDEKGKIVKGENCSREIEDIISILLIEGVDLSHCISRKDNGGNPYTITMVKEKIMPNNHLFYLAFRDHLTSRGYYVVEVRTDIDEKINFLISLGTTSADTVKLCSDLVNMTYLEKTYIFEKLKQSLAKELASYNRK